MSKIVLLKEVRNWVDGISQLDIRKLLSAFGQNLNRLISTRVMSEKLQKLSFLHWQNRGFSQTVSHGEAHWLSERRDIPICRWGLTLGTEKEEVRGLLSPKCQFIAGGFVVKSSVLIADGKKAQTPDRSIRHYVVDLCVPQSIVAHKHHRTSAKLEYHRIFRVCFPLLSMFFYRW
jgi:hypothetical protein